MKVLEQPLEEDEKVYYVFERNMKHRRIRYSIVVMGLCGMAVVTLHTMIIPFFCICGALFCIFWGIVPRANVPVAWVLTNKRYLCLCMDPQKYENTEVRLVEYIDIEPLRENLDNSGGLDIVADIVVAPFIWMFSSVRDYFQDKNVKTSKKYWADSKGLTLIMANEKEIKIEIDDKKTSSEIGRLLSTVLEQGWEHIPEISDIPVERTISLL